MGCCVTLKGNVQLFIAVVGGLKWKMMSYDWMIDERLRVNVFISAAMQPRYWFILQLV
jgi:hypothetical protein